MHRGRFCLPAMATGVTRQWRERNGFENLTRMLRVTRNAHLIYPHNNCSIIRYLTDNVLALW